MFVSYNNCVADIQPTTHVTLVAAQCREEVQGKPNTIIEVNSRGLPCQFWSLCAYPDRAPSWFGPAPMSQMKLEGMEAAKDAISRAVERDAAERREEQRRQAESFESDQAEILKGIPEEFAAFVRMQAWDRGHSSGYSEVLLIAREIAHDLRTAIEKYNKRVGVTV